MVWNFIDHIQQAYETGALNDELQLKLALQYENKLGMRSVYQSICDKLELHPDCNLLDKNDDAPGKLFTDSPAFMSECRQLHKAMPYQTVVNHIEPYQKLADMYGMATNQIKALSELGQSDKNRSNRLNLIRPTWNLYFNKRKTDWLWVSAKDKEMIDTKKQIQKLGLFHYRTQKKNTLFLQFQFKVSLCYKPSWLDAGLAFYFDSAPGCLEYGLTRDLATGQAGFKEWLTPIEQAELWDVSVLSLAEDSHFNVMTDLFLDTHSQRILEKRK